MCRSIVQLRRPERTSDDDVQAAALQFVRKVSGYRQPSRPNQAAFDHAVDEIAVSVRRLLDQLPPARVSTGARPPEAAGVRCRAEERTRASST